MKKVKDNPQWFRYCLDRLDEQKTRALVKKLKTMHYYEAVCVEDGIVYVKPLPVERIKHWPPRHFNFRGEAHCEDARDA